MSITTLTLALAEIVVAVAVPDLLNPFIEFARNPVGTLAALGYGLLLITLLIVTLGVVWQNALVVYVQAQKNWNRWNYRFPLGWVGRCAAIPFILAIDVWALGSLIWLVS